MSIKRYRSFYSTITLLSISVEISWAIVERAKDNGDIYTVSEETFLRDHEALILKGYATTVQPNIKSTTTTTVNPNLIDFEDTVALCNASFSIPMDYYIAFNTTAELPNLVDKTGMCFVRCFYEKSGIIENWKLNVDRIRLNIWPATGDTIPVCEKEGAGETNACVRAYAIAKCLTIRALVDARNKPPE